jgi:hypothetical protein
MVFPLLLETRPGVAAAEVAAAHQLAVEAVADAFHLFPLVDVGHDLHAPLLQPLDELRGRHPAVDYVVRNLLKYGTRARLPRARGVFHFGLCQALSHRLPARNIRCKVELSRQLFRDLFAALEVFRVVNCPPLVVDGRGQNMKFAVVVWVAYGDPGRLVEPPACGEHLCHPCLNLCCNVIFPTGADGYV